MTVRSEIVAVLDAVTPLGERVFADTPPEDTPYPCAAVLVDQAEFPMLSGDAQTDWWRQTGQVSVWQTIEDEDATLVAAVRAALDGLKVEAGLRVRVSGIVRFPDPDYPIVQHAITLTVAVPR